MKKKEFCLLSSSLLKNSYLRLREVPAVNISNVAPNSLCLGAVAIPLGR